MEQNQGTRRNGEVLIRFRSGVSEQEKATTVAALGARSRKHLRGESLVEKLELGQNEEPEAAAQRLRLNPAIEFAEPNFLIRHTQLRSGLSTMSEILGAPRAAHSGLADVTGPYGPHIGDLSPDKLASNLRPQASGVQPNDPAFGEQWALRNVGQNGGQFGSDIHSTDAWQTTTGSLSTVIAVIDSGIDFSHPDLINNQWQNPAPGTNGDLNGWDFITDSSVIKDEQGHGTAIAGIIAAEGNNSLGVAGVMWHGSLMSLRVLDSAGTGDVADAVEAIDYAVAHSAHVVNISWGTESESLALKDAIERAIRRDVVVVCSAGNNGQNVDQTPYYPASFGLRDLIAVASSDSYDQLAPWSNWGPGNVAVAAPGVNLLTTQMGGGYWLTTGTSASAPLVAGVAGLLRTSYPWLSSHLIVKAIKDGARQTGGMEGRVSAKGVVSASGALEKRRGAPNSGPNDHGPSPARPPMPERGGPAADGGFSTTPPPATTGAAPGASLPNLDQARNHQPTQPAAKVFIHSNLMCADCDPQGGGAGSTNYPSGDPNFSTARELPLNETGQEGVDLGSRNFNWSLPLLSLPGRAGLDLNLALTYNSLVWTKDGSSIKYNADFGSPAPGFQLGLPKLQQRFHDSLRNVDAYMLVTPSGSRVEMTQIGSSNLYESFDGGHIQLDATTANAPIVKTTDGSQLTFTAVSVNNEFRCREIKDRNGNYISAGYNATNGHLETITDTLERVVNFVYYADGNLQAIRQTWAGGVPHDWATFNYTQVLVAPGFVNVAVNGPNGTYTTVLTSVSLHDGSYYTFDYHNAFGQVYQINHYAADGHRKAYTSYDLNTSSGQTDCPRVLSRSDWATNWNGDTDWVPSTNEEAVTTYNAASDNSFTEQLMPDGTIYKEFYYTSGWRTGLPSSTEVWADGGRQKWTDTAWTQDDENLSYQKNPRVTETNIYDAANNRRRVTIDYGPYVAYGLPYEVIEYAANGSTMLRRTYTDYNLDPSYVSRRIIGLVSAVHVVDHATNTFVSKTTYDYDFNGEYLVTTPQTAPNHNANTADPAGRGNLVRVMRWDVTDINNASKALAKTLGYNSTGSVTFARDELGHQNTIGYNDAFSDNVNRNSYAYPTNASDPGGFQSLSKYNFDYGAVTWTQTPSPNSGQTAPQQTFAYDSAMRLSQITNSVNGAYQRWVYPTSQYYVQSYATLVSGQGEAYSVQSADGAGRVRAIASDLPPITGRYTGQYIIFDKMGRAVQQSNPIEMDGGWNPIGSDDTAWIYTIQTYDWKGRSLVTTNTDGSTRANSYGGCGCAGGEVTTSRDEGGRTRRITMDVLGRLTKVEEMNWGGTTVYSTTNYDYDVINQRQRTIINQAEQTRTFLSDVYGRLQSRTTPEQGTTTYSYFADDQVQTITDARGVSTTFAYNTRDLVKDITYTVPAGVAVTANVSFEYDPAGNRTSMTDGLGSVSYGYDQLSRLRTENRHFNGVNNPSSADQNFKLSYDYTLAGQLTSITNPWNVVVNYTPDKLGRTTSVTGSGYAGLTSYVDAISYRAFGAAKQISYHNGRTLSLQYNNRMWLSRWDLPVPSGVSNSSNALGYTYEYNHFGEGKTGRADFADSLYDSTLDRAWLYDHVGRLYAAFTGTEANQQSGNPTGPYAQAPGYDQWGNRTHREGWGGSYGAYINDNPTYTNNRLTGYGYDNAGNVTNDGIQTFTYDATGQQATASYNNQQFSHDGDRLRLRKVDSLDNTYFLRSSVLGGQVVADITGPQLSGFGPAQNATWTNVSSTIQVTGNSIQKVSGTNSWYDAGAVSQQTISAGNGYMEFTPDAGTWGMYGLGHTDTSVYFADIEYAFFLVAGTMNIYEAGNNIGNFGGYTPSDRLRVAVEGGVVKYYRNGTLLYTSTVTPQYPLQVDTSLNTVTAGVNNVVISGAPLVQNVTWTNVSSTIQVTGNSIQKVSGTNSWDDAGAVSSQTITSGDGYMEFTPGDGGSTYRMCGLGHTDSSLNFTDIEYAFYLVVGGALNIYEAGNNVGNFGSYAAADRLRVAVEGGVVKYYRNGTLLYTSTVTPQYPLQVDTSLNTVTASISNVVISGAGGSASGLSTKGYVYLGGQLLAIQSNSAVTWVHQEPFSKGQRLTDAGGNIVSTLEMDPWGGETSRSNNSLLQPHKYTSYERDSDGNDYAMNRRYGSSGSRFLQPDPFDGSYDLANPQSFNRYAYVQNDPVNFTDPSGLLPCVPENHSVECGWGSISAGFWGAGDLNNRQHPRDWALEDKPPSLQCPAGHICFLQPIEKKEEWYYRLIDFGPQPFDMASILTRAREQSIRKDQILRALGEFRSCVSQDPATEKYIQANNLAMWKASIPISPISVGKVSFRTGMSVRKGATLVGSLAVETTVLTLATGGILHVLFSNPTYETRDLRNAADRVKTQCNEQTKDKYGFSFR